MAKRKLTLPDDFRDIGAGAIKHRNSGVWLEKSSNGGYYYRSSNPALTGMYFMKLNEAMQFVREVTGTEHLQ